MAIKSINSLQGMTAADITANDVLVVGTPGDSSNPVKKIPAAAAFSGGGGDSLVEKLDVTMSGNVVSTEKTAAEIAALYAAGKLIYACTNIGAYALIHFGLFLTPEVTQDGYMLYGYTKGDSATLMSIVFTGSSADAPLSATIST